MNNSTSQYNPKPDVFGYERTVSRTLDSVPHSLIVEVGDSPQDTTIHTISGEIIPLVSSFTLEVDADEGVNVLTMKVLKPLVKQKEKANTPTKQIIVSDMPNYDRLVSDKKVAVAKKYDEKGKALSDAEINERDIIESLALRLNIPMEHVKKVLKAI